MKYLILSLSMFGSFTACVSKVMILQMPMVSMKESNSGTQSTWQEGTQVEEQWCSDEKPVKENSDGSKHYGMIDQVIWKAHERSHANFFKDAKFYQQGTCVSMNAEAVQTSVSPQSQPSYSNPPTEPTPGAAKKRKKG